jgi:hypothetical protein
MALPRTALLLLMLPVPAVAAYLAASMEDVSATAQCLPSAEAVRQQFPGAWASWTRRALDHNGEKCWYPAMRENHSHHIEAVLHHAAQKLMHKEAQREHGESESSGAGDKALATPPAAVVAGLNELGWNFATRSTNAVGVSDQVAGRDSSFDERFAAAREVSSVQKPSVIQRMMDPVGAIPNIP